MRSLPQEKWSATLWIHVGRYQERGPDGKPLTAPLPPAACRDDNEQCAEWAWFGCAGRPRSRGGGLCARSTHACVHVLHGRMLHACMQLLCEPPC